MWLGSAEPVARWEPSQDTDTAGGGGGGGEMELGLLAVDGKGLMVAMQAAGRKAPQGKIEAWQEKVLGTGEKNPFLYLKEERLLMVNEV